MWTTNDLKQVFGVTPQTVRNWTADFAQYLSDEATPSKSGARRLFTEDDVKVFALIRELTQSGQTYAQVRQTLADGKRGELPQMPISKDDTTTSLSPEEIYRTLAIMRERDEAIGQLKQLQLDKEEDRKTIERLNREIGRLELELELEQKKNQEVEKNRGSDEK